MDNLFVSRKFWAALIAIIIIVAQSVVPDFKLDESQLVDLMIIVSAYIIGVGIDPGSGMAGVLKSRKFWAAVVGIITIVGNGIYQSSLGVSMPIDANLFNTITAIISAYIMGVAIESKTK